MEFDDFKRIIQLLPIDQAENMRKKYIDTFVNTENEYYKKYIAVMDQCSDGLCYFGYLWDYLKQSVLIGFENIVNNIESTRMVYVFWDIHSKDKIFIENYWRFGKRDVIFSDFRTIIDNLEFLPEDIYIFDESFKWTVILTHEDINQTRYCLISGNIEI